MCVCHKSLRFWGIVAALPSAACQKLQLQLPLRFLLPRPLRIPFAGSSSIWSKAEQLSVKMRNTYAQSAHTHKGTHSGMHRHAQHNPVGRRLTVPIPVAFPPPFPASSFPAAADATHVPWPCHLLNEMSSKLAVNLFAIFLLRCY